MKKKTSDRAQIILEYVLMFATTFAICSFIVTVSSQVDVQRINHFYLLMLSLALWGMSFGMCWDRMWNHLFEKKEPINE